MTSPEGGLCVCSFASNEECAAAKQRIKELEATKDGIDNLASQLYKKQKQEIADLKAEYGKEMARLHALLNKAGHEVADLKARIANTLTAGDVKTLIEREADDTVWLTSTETLCDAIDRWVEENRKALRGEQKRVNGEFNYEGACKSWEGGYRAGIMHSLKLVKAQMSIFHSGDIYEMLLDLEDSLTKELER